MEILHARGDILDLSRDDSDAVALWVRSGFNVRDITWRSLEREFASRLSPPLMEGDRPWKSATDLVWEVHPPLQRLRYVYLFSNPSDSFGYGSLDEVSAAVSRCLDRLNSEGVRRLSMMHMPVSPTGDRPTDEEDLASARAMVQALRDWDALNPGQMDRILLVDKVDDFSRVLPPGSSSPRKNAPGRA